MPPKAERGWGVVSIVRSGPGKTLLILSAREDQSLYTRVRLHRVREKNGLLAGGNYSEQSYHGALFLIRDRGCMA